MNENKIEPESNLPPKKSMVIAGSAFAAILVGSLALAGAYATSSATQAEEKTKERNMYLDQRECTSMNKYSSEYNYRTGGIKISCEMPNHDHEIDRNENFYDRDLYDERDENGNVIEKPNLYEAEDPMNGYPDIHPEPYPEPYPQPEPYPYPQPEPRPLPDNKGIPDDPSPIDPDKPIASPENKKTQPVEPTEPKISPEDLRTITPIAPDRKTYGLPPEKGDSYMSKEDTTDKDIMIEGTLEKVEA